MDYQTAVEIYRQIKATTLVELKDSMVEVAVRYAHLRVDWLLADSERRQQLEDDRTRAHNAFIAACDILSRNMGKQGEEASWRGELGSDRKCIGDFACYLHCILAVSAR